MAHEDEVVVRRPDYLGMMSFSGGTTSLLIGLQFAGYN